MKNSTSEPPKKPSATALAILAQGGITGKKVKSEKTAVVQAKAGDSSSSESLGKPTTEVVSKVKPSTPAPTGPVIIKKSDTTFVMDISPSVVGWVIGRSGIRIKDIQSQSGCKMWVDQDVPNDQPRKMFFHGNKHCIDIAVAKVNELIQSAPVLTTNDTTSRLTSTIVDCPAHLVGLLIGKRGWTIKKIQQSSGAQISINQSVREGLPRKIIVSGDTDFVNVALELIDEVLRDKSTLGEEGFDGDEDGSELDGDLYFDDGTPIITYSGDQVTNQIGNQTSAEQKDSMTHNTSQFSDMPMLVNFNQLARSSSGGNAALGASLVQPAPLGVYGIESNVSDRNREQNMFAAHRQNQLMQNLAMMQSTLTQGAYSGQPNIHGMPTNSSTAPAVTTNPRSRGPTTGPVIAPSGGGYWGAPASGTTSFSALRSGNGSLTASSVEQSESSWMGQQPSHIQRGIGHAQEANNLMGSASGGFSSSSGSWDPNSLSMLGNPGSNQLLSTSRRPDGINNWYGANAESAGSLSNFSKQSQADQTFPPGLKASMPSYEQTQRQRYRPPAGTADITSQPVPFPSSSGPTRQPGPAGLYIGTAAAAGNISSAMPHQDFGHSTTSNGHVLGSQLSNRSNDIDILNSLARQQQLQQLQLQQQYFLNMTMAQTHLGVPSSDVGSNLDRNSMFSDASNIFSSSPMSDFQQFQMPQLTGNQSSAGDHSKFSSGSTDNIRQRGPASNTSSGPLYPPNSGNNSSGQVDSAYFNMGFGSSARF